MINCDTTVGSPTRSIAIPEAMRDEFPQLLDQLEMYRTETIGELAVGETAKRPSQWMRACQSRISPTIQLITRLTNLFETPEASRWPGTKWPVKRAFEDARAFITELPLAYIPEPEIRFADDGEINFLWTSKNVHIDLGFYGTGTYSYFGCNGEGQEIQDEAVLASDGLALAIKNMLIA